MALDRNFIDIVKSAPENDLLAVIGEVVQLTKDGGLYKGRCPFPHSGSYQQPVFEETGSLTVYPEQGTWYCYGCRRGNTKGMNTFGQPNYGNDAIAFRRELWRLEHGGEEAPFDTIVIELAQGAGIQPPEDRSDPEVRHLQKKTTDRNRIYYQELQRRPDVKQYLYNRGLNDATILKFRLGVVPDTDFFELRRGRLSIGITGVHPNPDKAPTIGMSYRTLSDEKPKYRHDSRSKIWDTSHNVFGQTYARSAIRKMGYAILCECFFGTMALHQAGLENTIGTMGAAPYEDQLKMIRRWTDKVQVWVEDAAGMEGAKQSLPMLLEMGFQVRWVLADGLDADEAVLKVGPDQIEAWMAERSQHALLYLINQQAENLQAGSFRTEAARVAAKIQALDSLAPTLRAIRRPADRAVFCGLVSEKFGVPAQLLLDEVAQPLKAAPFMAAAGGLPIVVEGVLVS